MFLLSRYIWNSLLKSHKSRYGNRFGIVGQNLVLASSENYWTKKLKLMNEKELCSIVRFTIIVKIRRHMLTMSFICVSHRIIGIYVNNTECSTAWTRLMQAQAENTPRAKSQYYIAFFLLCDKQTLNFAFLLINICCS